MFIVKKLYGNRFKLAIIHVLENEFPVYLQTTEVIMNSILGLLASYIGIVDIYAKSPFYYLGTG